MKLKIKIENGLDWESFVIDTNNLKDTHTSLGWKVQIEEVE